MQTIKHTVHGNVVVIDKPDFEMLQATYFAQQKVRIEARIDESRKQIKEGKTTTNDEVFARLDAKYGH